MVAKVNIRGKQTSLVLLLIIKILKPYYKRESLVQNWHYWNALRIGLFKFSVY